MAKDNKKLRFVEIQGRNVLNLKCVSIRPDGKRAIRVGGKNGEGKSNALSLFEMLIRGKAGLPEHGQVIREGATTGDIVGDFGDLHVTKVFTQGSTKLIVEDSDGNMVKPPQERLDRLFGKIGFDPSEFLRMKAKDQAECLRTLVGLDLEALDQERAKLYDQRTEVGRQIKQREGEIAGLPTGEGLPEKEISLADLHKQYREGTETNHENERARGTVNDWTQRVADHDGDIAEIEKELKKLQKRLADAKQSRAKAQEKADEAASIAAELVDVDLSPIEQAISTADVTNQKVREAKHRGDLAANLRVLRHQYQDGTTALNEIDSKKALALTNARFPVEGIGFDADGVTYLSRPLARYSDGERLRVACAIGIALGGELPVLILRHGSFLDEDNLVIVEEMVGQAGAYALIERVGRGEDCDLVIEDGEIVVDRIHPEAE